MRRIRTTPLILGLGILLAACSSGTAATPTAAPPTDMPSASAPPPAAGVTVNAGATAIGDALVDGEGMTLYAFTPDSGGTPTCYDDCAAAWPPLTSDAVPTAGTGLDAADFGLTARTDGSKQVTFNGWPLYYFASDAAAGDTKGQGLGGKWYVIAPDGTLIK